VSGGASHGRWAAGWFAALIGWTALISFYGLDGGAGFDPPDVWVAQTAREMSESTDWRGYIIPKFSGETRMQKSPGPYWAVLLTAWLRGAPVDEVAARVPSAVSAVVLVATIFWLALRMAGERAAVFAGFACASSLMLLYWSHRGASDLGAAALMTLSLACFWVGAELHAPGPRRTALWLGAYLAAGLAMLYKMPMPLVCVGLPAAAYVLLCRRWSLLASGVHLFGLLLFLLPWLPWSALAVWIEPMAWNKWVVEFFDRFTGNLPNVREQQTDWRLYFLYPGVALVFTVPFCLSLPQAIWRGFSSASGIHPRGRWFLLIWFFTLLAFFTAAAGKETRYFLPAMPPLFVLLGVELAAFFDPQRRAAPKLDRAALWAVCVLAPVGAIGGGVFLRRLSDELSGYGVLEWGALGPAYTVTAGLVVVGVVLAAVFYTLRREGASFAALVGTMWAAFLYAWPNLMPVVASQAAFKDFAAQLRELPPEYRSSLRQIAHQDARIIWYSDVRFPRVMDQLELLRRQGGRRSREAELRIVGEEMVRQIESDELVLFVSSPEDYALFHLRAPEELAAVGRKMPRTYPWLVARKGRPHQRYIVYGNRPPPWPPPELPLSKKTLERIAAAASQPAAGAAATSQSGAGP
jgi:4-amino-4-deoxy-L-arabinose transferase-like glycosyltransferase